MDFKEYQEISRKTALYPDMGKNFVYPALGLAGETGEVVEKVKKILRDRDGEIDGVMREEIKKELGDVLWYLAQFSTEIGVSLDDAATLNIRKLSDRMERDKIHGSGDNR